MTVTELPVRATEDDRPVITQPGIYDDLAEVEYHRDPVPGGSLSASGVKSLLPPSCPAKFHWERTHPVFKDEYDLGSAAHKVVLGIGPEVVVVDAGLIAEMAASAIDAKQAKLWSDTAAKGDPDSWATSAAKTARELARRAGKIPVLKSAWLEVQAMRDALMAHPYAGALFDPERGGHAEQSLFWQDAAHGIWKRSRLDWLPAWDGTRRLVVPDYKTADHADPAGFGRSAANFGYCTQADFYLSGIAALLGAVDAKFLFVVQEKAAPYLVSVCELDEEALSVGHARNERASALFAECTAKNRWPGYCDDDIARVSLPRWATYREDF